MRKTKPRRRRQARGIGAAGEIPDRHIYCLDLRDFNKHDPYVEEIRRIAAECRERREAKAREKAANSPAIVQLGLVARTPLPKPTARPIRSRRSRRKQLLAAAGRRWYPVIDYSRCTNCLECLDFCLFGVYGVDSLERIVVENQDTARRAARRAVGSARNRRSCSPNTRSPAIAGADGRRGRRAEDRPDASSSAATSATRWPRPCRSATANWSTTAATPSAWRSASRSARRTSRRGRRTTSTS